MKRKCIYLFLCLVLASIFLMPNYSFAAEEGLLVKKIVLKGNNALGDNVLLPIVKKYEGKKLTLSELKTVASLITEEYIKRGYLISRAYVPEQKVSDGVVEIAIIEGKVGEVKVQGEHRYYSTEFIKKHFSPVVEKAFNQDSLERAILVLNEYPKLKVKAGLQPGAEPGTSDLVVTAENSIPFNLTLDYNNFGSKYVGGRSRFGATLDVGNLIKEGSLLSLRGVLGEKTDEFKYGRIFYTIPVNALGTKVGAYYAYGNFDVGREFAVLDMSGKSESYGISATHPFIKKRLESLSAEIGFDVKNSKMLVFGEDVSSRDKTRSIKAGVSYEKTDTTGRFFTSLYATQGLGHVLGAMENDDPKASRAGADNTFTKFNANIARLQRITPWLFALLKGSGQLGLNSLLAGEQYPIGGQDSVRGFYQGEYMGDSGYSLTGELRVAPLTNKELFQIAAFIDNGYIDIKDPVPGQDKHKSITGAGGGIRLSLPYDFNVRADIGFPVHPTHTLDGGHYVLYLEASKRF